MVQDRAIHTLANQYKVAQSIERNGTIFSDLEPLFLLNISETVRDSDIVTMNY